MKRWEMGVAALALCAFIPLSRADLIINNLSDSQNAILTQGLDPIGQEFTTASSGGTLTISSVTLALYNYASGPASASIELYSTSSGLPSGAATLLGNFSVSAGHQTVTLTPSAVQLYANTTYAIVLDNIPSTGFGLDATTTSGSGGSASFGDIYYNNGTWTKDAVDSGIYNWRMDLQAVPEVPMTGMVMGLGALVIALGHTLRRKFSQTL
jgi:hypothetical protein